MKAVYMEVAKMKFIGGIKRKCWITLPDVLNANQKVL